MITLKSIESARRKFNDSNAMVPRIAEMTYDSGLAILKDVINERLFPGIYDRDEAIKLMMEGDRNKLTDYLESLTLYGMQIKIADILIGDTNE